MNFKVKSFWIIGEPQIQGQVSLEESGREDTWRDTGKKATGVI